MRTIVVMIVLGLGVFLQGRSVLAAPVESLVKAAGLIPSAKPEPAVDFQLSNLDGDQVRLSEQRGKVVFLNFWATWCPPCLREMPEMEQLFQSFRQRPFVMWAVAMQEDREQVAPFFKKHRLHLMALLDVDGEVSAQYRIMGLPTTYIIDCSGHTVGRAVGPRQWNDETVRRLLTKLLEDKQCG